MSRKEKRTDNQTQTDGVKLLDGEQVLHNVRPSWAAFITPIHVVLTLSSFGLWLLIWGPIVFLGKKNNRYVVTTERLIQRRGIFSTGTVECRIEDVKRLETGQSLSESLFGVGNVQFSVGAGQSVVSNLPFASGAGGSGIVFAGVPDHEAIAQTAREAQRS